MTLTQFLEADEMEQIESIWKGKLIAETRDKEYYYKLYEIDSFFVEVKKSLEHGYIKEIIPFETKEDVLLLRYRGFGEKLSL